jgi:protein-arginine deiminase
MRFPLETEVKVCKSRIRAAEELVLKQPLAALAKLRAVLEQEISLEDSQILRIPTLFQPKKRLGFLTGNMVNMVVLGTHCLMAKPFGPEVAVEKLRQFLDAIPPQLQQYGFTRGNLEGMDYSGLVKVELGVQVIDLFELYVFCLFHANGLEAHFIDNWEHYHCEGGELHCGTNTLRKPLVANWWEFEEPK